VADETLLGFLTTSHQGVSGKGTDGATPTI
jgi:hypothetical protein